ncbi:MAG: hypothetical protein QOF60_1197 [Actinomycetota bacterium]|jgi:hypothetical protein|nr:hypothetical protein [Actinomycetota bacterium]
MGGVARSCPRFRLSAVLLVVVMALAVGLPAAGAIAPAPVGTSGGMLLPAMAPATRPAPALAARRERFVTPALGVLRQTLAAAAADRSTTVRFELFADTTVIVPATLFETRPDGFSWGGAAIGASGFPQSAVVTYYHPTAAEAARGLTDSVLGEFWDGLHRYRLDTAAGAVYSIVEVDQRAMDDKGTHDGPPQTGDEPGQSLPLPLLPPGQSVAQGTGGAVVTGTATIDVLVVYTLAAVTARSEIGKEINNQLAQANMANDTSQVPFHFRLAHAAQVDYTEHTDDIDQDRRDLVDDKVPGVSAMRDTYGADLVVLAGYGYAGYCGIAATVGASAGTAFAVVNADPSHCSYTMAHEMGHLLGLRHDWRVDQESGYNHGFVSAAGQFRTIMAYDDQSSCPAGCPRIDQWSDPNTNYGAFATGVPEGQPNPADNARALKENYAGALGFRSLPHTPVGNYDSLTDLGEGVQLSGWAFDNDTPGPISIRVDDNGGLVGVFSANMPRQDVADTQPSTPGNTNEERAHHGFYQMFGFGNGGHHVCVTALNDGAGGDTSLGCKDVTVTTVPFGNYDWIVAIPGGARVAGWAIDPDTAGAIQVHVYADDTLAASGTADVYRSDVGSAYPAYGPNHGFIVDVPIPAATDPNVCVYGINYGVGHNMGIGCARIHIDHQPFGSFDSISRAPGGATVRGWALDPDTAKPIPVHVYVDGVLATSGTAGDHRYDIGSLYPEWGPNHAFTLRVPMSSGRNHQVCITAGNVGAGADQPLDHQCRDFYPDPNPFGYFDGVGRVDVATVYAQGWAIDPDTDLPVPVTITIDGLTPVAAVAHYDRNDVAANYPDYGTKHGFDNRLPALAGPHTICATAVNVPAAGPPDPNANLGTNTSLGCRMVAF